VRLDVGDIILFNNSELIRHTIKIATGSEWDHIGLVAKTKGRKGLFLLEAVNDGVRLFNLCLRLDFYRETAKLGIRKLLADKTPEMIAALVDFVEESIGKPYSSMMDVVRSYNGTILTDDQSYFCSQLVAVAYQRMGLLSKDMPANLFLPVHFEIDERREERPPAPAVHVTLLKGRLGPIMVIPQKTPDERAKGE